MRQKVVVSANASQNLTRLVSVAIANQLKLLKQDIEASLARLETIEIKAGYSSLEFEKKLENGELPETLDVLDWKMELASLRLLQQKVECLEEAEVS